MANNIELRTQFVTMLDEIFKNASVTSVLDTNNELVQAGANAKEIKIPKYMLDGLADYDRATGYADGAVTLTYETKTFNFDRGRKFVVDAMDNQESANVAFGALAGEFIRTKVVPEVDTFRLSTYAGKAGSKKAEALTSANIVSALRACANAMDEAEVPEEGRILFITPTNLALIEDIDTTKSKAVLDRFGQIIKVPQSRMYTDVKLKAEGGFEKDTTSKDINFLCVVPEAVIQIPKHEVPKMFTPEENQDADAYIYTYRNYQMAEALDNKVKAIYVSTVA